jgi:hypothetical protein
MAVLNAGLLAALYLQENSWHLFLLEAESAPKPYAAGMIR